MKIVKVMTIISFLVAGATLLPALELAASIAEIEVIRGEQKYLYIKGGNDQGVAKGMAVSIYSPVDGKDDLLVGRGEVLEVYKRLCKVKVVELNYPISGEGYVIFGALTEEEIEHFKVEMVKRDEEIKKEKEREREERAKRFSIMKYNGGDALYLSINYKVSPSIGQVGLINDNKGSLSGSGEVEVVRLFKNAVLVRLRDGAYINSSYSTITFVEGSKESEGEEPQNENYLIGSVTTVSEKEGKLYLTLHSEGPDHYPFPESIGYIYNDNMMLERAGVVRFTNSKVEVIELYSNINPHAVVLFEGRLQHFLGSCTDYAGRKGDSEMPPIVGMVKEVGTGVEKNYIYAAIGKKNKGVKVGLIGYLYAEPQMVKKIGKVEVVEVFHKMSKLKVLDVDSEIPNKAVVFFEVDPRYYIK